jgi:uncharacterized protein with FMN-binding domain
MSKPQPPRKPTQKPAGKVSRQPIDPLLLQRLEELGQRRPAGAPLPPPNPASAARPAANATKTAATAAGKPAGARPAPGSQEAKLAAAAERAAAARAAKAGGPAVKTAARPGRKAKPARASKIAAAAVSAATTLALAGLFARQDNGTTDSVVLTAGTDPTAGTTATTAPAAVTTPTTAAATGSTAAASTTVATTAPAAAPNTIADGTYAGQASQNRFGTVQVQAVYSGGQLTDVQILSYPDGDRRSLRISQVAIPMLVDQAVQAGGANISGVSGATYTSRSYVASLQSAIDAAKQASGVTG